MEEKTVATLIVAVDEELHLQTEDGQVVVSSRYVAERFGKNHKEVLRTIENHIEVLGGAQNCANLFIPSKYQHPQNKQWYPEYLLTRDGFTLLAMGFTGQEALRWKLKYIEAFNKMENIIKGNQSQLTKKQELALKVYDGGSNALIAHKELVKIEVAEETAKLRDGTNKILSAQQVVDMLGIRKLTTTLLHQWFSENNFGEMKIFKGERSRQFQPSQKFIDYVAVKGYSFTGTTISGNKIKVVYSTAMVDRLLDRHMASIVQFVKISSGVA